MNCNKNSTRCGCSDVGLSTPCPSCSSGTYICPDANPCAENFSDNCIIHTGDSIILNGIEINQGDSITNILQKLMILENGDNPKLAPIGLKSTSITSSTISLSWTLQQNNPIIVLSYGTTIALGTDISLSNSDKSYTLTGLNSDTYYYIKVSASSNDSVIIKVKTLTT